MNVIGQNNMRDAGFSQCDVAENACFLELDALSLDEYCPTVRNTVVPSSARSSGSLIAGL